MQLEQCSVLSAVKTRPHPHHHPMWPRISTGTWTSTPSSRKPNRGLTPCCCWRNSPRYSWGWCTSTPASPSTITIWYGAATAKDTSSLQCIIRSAQKVISWNFPSFQDLSASRSLKGAGEIVASHPGTQTGSCGPSGTNLTPQEQFLLKRLPHQQGQRPRWLLLPTSWLSTLH